jgi:acyl-CoA hydrolase
MGSIPTFLSDIPFLMRRGRVPLDVAFLNVSPPDRHGFCSLGTEVCAALPAAQSAKIIIAQVHPGDCVSWI